MTREQVVAILIFLKEGAGQVDNARRWAAQAGDQQTEINITSLLRNIVAEIDRLEFLVQRLPPAQK